MLEAARDLFVEQGVDRVSMDAVSARARVSKATVYGYFGDKQRLFRAILADAAESLYAFASGVIDTRLGDGRGIDTPPELEAALTATAVDLGTTVVGSSRYAAVLVLATQQRWQDRSADDGVDTDAVEKAFAARIAHYADLGLLDVADPRRAADHFFALTLLLAFNEQDDPLVIDTERVRQTMIDGAHVFFRAYSARRPPTDGA